MSTPVPSRSETQKCVGTPQSKPPHAEWKLIHRASDPSVYSKEKLLDNGWSVPIKQSISELSASELGVCLATTSEARKAAKDLKSDKAYQISMARVQNFMFWSRILQAGGKRGADF